MGSYTKIKSPKVAGRLRRQRSMRKRVVGTAERPRLSVFRSNAHIYAQVIDDGSQKVLATACDLDKSLAPEISGKKKSEVAKVVGMAIGKRLLEKEIKQVVFDRNGFIYHGRVKAVAEGAREAGLEF